MVQVSLKVLEEMKTYIEEMEVAMDYEFGSCRTLEQLKEDKALPMLYKTVSYLAGLAQRQKHRRGKNNV